MADYNYYDEVKDSLVDWLNENEAEWQERIRDGFYLDDIINWVQDEAWVSDSVTGNASGSYYCNAYKAEEALAHNWDLLEEALTEFGCGHIDAISKGAEWCDVTIRCYMLSQVIEDALEESGVKEYLSKVISEDTDELITEVEELIGK